MPAMPDKIEGHTLDHLLSVATRAVKDKTAHSVVLDLKAEEKVPKFDFSELDIGKVLGRGGFCVVNEIVAIALKEGSQAPQNDTEDDEHRIYNVVQDRNFMAAHFVRQGKDYRYAIKTVQDSATKTAQLFVNAVVDLAIEARFLAVIRHPNIIKMRAMSSGSPYAGDFFLVLDKLYDILVTRLKAWKKKLPGKLARMAGGARSKKFKDFWAERLTVCYDLSCALKHLHDNHVIYRDIKPDNIGFDVRGDVKIFDFGLAKELDPEKRLPDGTYKLTADTGSPRYMAPEVFLEQPYNETCDVYSFCILMWQMLKVENPFEGFTANLMIKTVYKGGARPKIDPSWSNDIVATLNKGWNQDVQKRSSMEEVSEVLREIIAKETDEEVDDLIDASRKSALSLEAKS